MTDPNSISSKPRNKSFDENIELHNLKINYDNPNDINLHVNEEPKICFNPNCRNDGNKCISIIGRYAGYKDYAVPYRVCDECSSQLEIRHELLNQLVNVLQPHGEVYKTGVDIKNPDPISNRITITTKDLNELICGTPMELIEEYEQDNEKATCIDIEPVKQRGCYNIYCTKEGTDRIDILNSTTLLADHEIPYFVCDDCYTFFEYRRKEPLVFPSLGALFEMESERGKKVTGVSPCTGQEVITTRDLHNLLKSTGSRQNVEE
jgi:hypothetical protein